MAFLFNFNYTRLNISRNNTFNTSRGIPADWNAFPWGDFLDSNEKAIEYSNLFLGIGGLSLNLLSLICILFNFSFMKHNSAFLTSLIFGNIFNALYSVVNGAHRLGASHFDGVYTSWDCMLAPFIPSIALLGGQAPSITVFIYSCERFVALVTPTWYFKYWKNKHGWYIVAATYIYVIATVGFAWFVVGYYAPVDSGWADAKCYIHSVLGLYLTRYFYGLQIFCGVSSMVITVIALISGWRILKQTKLAGDNDTRFRRQVMVTLNMLVLAVIDFFLVAVPNFILYIALVPNYDYHISTDVSNHGAVAYCCYASVCILAYFFVNTEFRSILLKFYKIDKLLRAISKVIKWNKSTTVKPF